MILTIDIASEIEARLKNQALAHGYETISDYAKRFLRTTFTNKMSTLDEIFASFREHTERISKTEIDDLVKKARREFFAGKKFSSKFN